MFEWIRTTVEALGYWGVVSLTFLENLFPPIPSEVVIPLAGFVAAEGSLKVSGVIAAGTLGAVGGATMWYGVGRRLGQKGLRDWVDRHGRWLTLSAEDVDRAERWFERRGAQAVLMGRLVPGVRTFVSLPAGFSGMPFGPFLMYSAIGSLIWTAALAYAGVVLKANYAVVADYIGVATNVLLATIAVLTVRRYIRCWRAKRTTERA